MKKGKSSARLICLLIIVLMAFCVPSIVQAESNVCTITYSNGKYSSPIQKRAVKGTLEDPIHIDLKYDEVVINFGNNTANAKIETPFYFLIVDDENTATNYAKYTVDMVQMEKKVIFKRLAASDDLTDFYVLPDKETTAQNFIQPGAIYDKDVDYSIFTRPLYCIESHFHFNKPSGVAWDAGIASDNTISKIETVLGNTTLKDSKAASPQDAADRTTFVFCESFLKEKECVEFSEAQQDNAIVTVTTFVDGFGIDTEKVKSYKSTDKYTMKDITSNNGDSYTFDDKEARVVYAFWGLTSLALNDNDVGAIEEVLTKILLSIGSLFRAIVTKVGGQALTIDALIFNTYPQTTLDFWGTEGVYTDVFKLVINGWYNAFKVWTSVVLVIVVVAMGIKTFLYAGTKNEKKIQNMLVGWVLAVGLLYLGPYFMKYAVILNDSFVKVIRAQSKYSVYSVYNSDFLNEYDIDMDLQYGEDSETVKLIETLQALYGKIEENLEKAKTEKAQAMERIQATKDKWTVTEDMPFLESVRIQQKHKDKHGNPLFMTFDEACEKVKDYTAFNPKFTEENIKEYLTSEEWLAIERVDFSGNGEPVGDFLESFFEGGLINADEKWTKQLLKDLQFYAEAERDFNKYTEHLEATELAMEMANKGVDLESQMKERAGETYRIIYVLVWFLMIYQLVALMFLYYKRLIVTAMLIVVYPLVIMMYAIEKVMGIEKSQVLKTWLMEYMVNIFIQSLHALLYIMLIEAGLKAFEDDADNWIFFLMAMLALFPLEGIVKSILGMKASSVTGLSESAKKTTAVITASAIAAKSVLGSHKNIDNKYKAQEQREKAKQEKQDKNREALRKYQDNRIMRKYGGDSSEDAKDRLEQARKKRAQQDATRKKKREASKRARERRRKIEHVTQPLKNLTALSSLATNFMALGGDAEDVPIAAAIGKIVSGNAKKHANVAKTESASKPKTSQAKDNYQNNRNNGGGANNTNGSRTTNTNSNRQPGQPAAAPAYKNGRTTPTLGERRAENKKAKNTMDIQNKYRARLAGMQVHTNTPNISVNEDTINSEED